ncbi:unnamed protein product [Parnassius apollo]|uniref:(apollo) hypothetical protein n=1 Tax=Parnassius apollo TaxID=110799 RepID=A0A8S3XF55_PARAO|nr:unnamed protein product [Parnassius apollo]
MNDEIDMIIISLLCEEEVRIEQEQARKKQRIRLHDISNSRFEEGEYYTLLPRLKKDPIRFHTYFRMSQYKFIELLQIMQPHIRSMDTLFRKAIGVEEKLMVTIT